MLRRIAFYNAFDVWSQHSKMTFKEVSDIRDAQIKISFASGLHGDGFRNAFDGPGTLVLSNNIRSTGISYN